ncbi:6-phospho-3-hexuloisomerase [Thermaerobacillus caldiproteolyticus]|uniref:6-phospho-3-hexuloisomerase n=1 Tax=Thermaerobacillus caldiproteolyticus TaxID=247480 RepID=A0A7V9Z7D6_9BACL|nr:6-phospho-3-hexuloisomerase [Anoxybacillus caldiproteolyticus]MBA2875310.1 6-phospho-3-hexuloisomerase [Anoxybacillus caldiproteolyticus]QPA32620.1 6-phospho-3-hexuloisomerase [Anoxybacillus caldiproteolyticus]
MKHPIQTIFYEMEQVFQDFDHMNIEHVATLLQKANRIFIAGEGRSGLMAKAFAMRLMHLGANVYVVGETITPALQKGDTLVVVSGSGTTKSTVWIAEKAKQLDCYVIAFTTDVASELAANASLTIHVPAATKYRRGHEKKSVQPLSSLFDQCMHLIFDAICLQYAAVQNIKHESALKQHSNLE